MQAQFTIIIDFHLGSSLISFDTQVLGDSFARARFHIRSTETIYRDRVF